MSKIILKKSSVTGKIPVAGDLDFGELALNYADGKLYFKNTSNTVSSISSGSGGASITVSETAPESPIVGMLWWNSATGILSIYYDDGSSSQWVSTDGGTEIAQPGESGPATSPYSNQYVLTGSTVTGVETEIFINGIANSRIPVLNNTICAYSVDIVARRTDAPGQYAVIQLKSAASNIDGTVANIGNVYEIIIARTIVGLNVDARVSDTTDSINIYVMGISGQSYTWRAVVNTIET